MTDPTPTPDLDEVRRFAKIIRNDVLPEETRWPFVIGSIAEFAIKLCAEVERLRAEVENLLNDIHSFESSEAYRILERKVDQSQAELTAERAKSTGYDERISRLLEDLAEAQGANSAGLVDAASELLECADLRGDADLPHPADDPLLWTARMQDAWEGLRAALDAK